MAELIRDTALGQFIRLVTRRRVFQYPEERPDFELPVAWLDALSPADSADTSLDAAPLTTTRSLVIEAARRPSSSSDTDNNEKKLPSSSSSSDDGTAADVEIAAESLPTQPPLVPTKTKDGSLNLITWYSASDQENPQNWSSLRKASVTLLICLYTFVVYCSSAIYTPSIGPIMEIYGVSITVASLGLAMFVLGYGTGPLIFSPLGEIASIGRNPVYIVTMILFFILSFPAAFVTNVPGLMVLRFLQGFFGSPCLASGAATLGDMYNFINVPYALIAWVSAAYCGPALGPLLTGYSVPAMGWRWSMYEILFMAAPITLLMFALLPETSADNILLRRARRLRSSASASPLMTEEVKRTLYSPAEKNEAAQSFTAVLLDAMIKPLQITALDPAILFVQVYTAIIYGIYYSFFEVFPLVYTTPGVYGFSIGETGLIFLCILVSCLLGVAVYLLYLHYSAIPTLLAALSGRIPMPPQESRLVPALFAAFGPTAGLFLFAWTARESIHWAVPTLGIVIYGSTCFVVMQCIFVYVPLSYPHYAASLFAGNDFFRSALAFASVLFAKPLFDNLGIAKGTTLLGGLSTIGIMGIWALWAWGARMRAMSRFAVSE